MAHVKNSKLLTIGTLAPLRRSLWQHTFQHRFHIRLLLHSVTFTFKNGTTVLQPSALQTDLSIQPFKKVFPVLPFTSTVTWTL